MPLLSLTDVHKTFGPVRALKGVNLEVRAGEVHGVIGENGAGKSTLMKILSGVYAPDRGRMLLDGQPYAPQSPLDGRAAGISMIYQELVLAPHLSVEENVTLGIERTRGGWIQPRTADVRAALATLGQENLDPATPTGELGIGKQQLVEIARALVADARIVVMDEPTSSLSAEDTRSLFQVIRRLTGEGVAVIYISHFLEEVEEICDRFTVIRDGETVATGAVAETSIGTLIEYMVGRSVDELYPLSDHTIGSDVLLVSGLSGAGQKPKSVDLVLRSGEILGVFGLVGAGRSETIRALFGLHQGENGTVVIRGFPELRAEWITPPRALRRGINLLSENRKEEGLAVNLSLLTNLTLSALRRYSRMGFIGLRREAQQGRRWIETLNVKSHSPHQPASTLSGGNQQKVCLARILHHDSNILFLDEPTRGLDINSKADIYRLIHQLATQGKAIVIISSYLPELRGVCDSLAVMHKGVISESRPVKEWTQHAIMQFATAGR